MCSAHLAATSLFYLHLLHSPLERCDTFIEPGYRDGVGGATGQEREPLCHKYVGHRAGDERDEGPGEGGHLDPFGFGPGHFSGSCFMPANGLQSIFS